MFDIFRKSVWISSQSSYKNLKVIDKNLDSFNWFFIIKMEICIKMVLIYLINNGYNNKNKEGYIQLDTKIL